MGFVSVELIENSSREDQEDEITLPAPYIILLELFPSKRSLDCSAHKRELYFTALILPKLFYLIKAQIDLVICLRNFFGHC